MRAYTMTKKASFKHNKTERRINDLLVSFAAISLLIAMSSMVSSDVVDSWEVTSFKFINNLPNFLFPILWPFMQYGVFVTIPFVSAVAIYFKRFKLAILLLVGGIGIYYGARIFKEYVPRGRPGDLLEGVNAREYFAPWSKGFTSGHTAVASTIATFSHYYLSKKWQIISLVTLGIVVLGRVYVGAHLPLDVIGGVALGVAVASLINFIVGVPVSDTIKVENTKEWIKQHRPRHPGDIIRIGIGLVVFLLATSLAISGTVGALEEAVFHVINILPSALNPVIQLIMQFGALYFVFVAALIALMIKHNRLFLKILAGGVGVWSLVRLLKVLIDRERPAYLLTEIIERGSNSGLLGFPSGHAAVAGLIATVAAPYISKSWSRVIWGLAITTALGRVFVGAHLPLDIIAGLALGWLVGSLMNVAFGTPAKPWPKQAIQDRLKNAGLALRNIGEAEVDARGSIPLAAKTYKGRQVFIKIIDNEHRNADILYRIWRFITIREVQDEVPFATAKQLAEHEAYLSIQAAQAGVNVPEVLLASPVTRSASIIVAEKIDAEILTQYKEKIDQNLLQNIWRQVEILHSNGIAHRDLRATNIMIDKNKKPWLIDFSFSQTGASETLLTKDIVELLVSSSLISNVDLAVSSAVSVLGKEKLRKSLPYIQPLALSSYTRKLASKSPELLNNLIKTIEDKTNSGAYRKERLSRVNMRWIVFLALMSLAIYYFIPRVGELNESIDALKSAEPLMVIAILLASIATYLLAAVVVLGATRKRLSYKNTLLLQFGGTAVNRITPKGVGGAVLLERYLEKQGLGRAEATVSMSLVYAVGIIVHVLLTLLSVAIDDPDLFQKIELTSNQLLLLGSGIAVVLTGVFFIPRAKVFIKQLRQSVVLNLREVSRSPKKALQLLGGSMGVTLMYAAAFGFSVDAFGPGIPIEQAIFVYLASGILASAAPTPGGLGATEAMLSIGLTLTGVATGQAVTSVLVFRFLTFWLPILPGIYALRHLRQKDLV